MKNYLCRPEIKSTKTKALVFALAAVAILFFIFSIRFPAVKALLQLFTASLLLLVIQISNRFLLSKYRYALEDGYLLLSYRQGPKEKNLGGIPVTAETKILDHKTWEQEKNSHHTVPRFSYCQNLFPENPYYLLAPEEKGGFLLLIFEPDETLISLLEEQIGALKAGNFYES